MRVVMIKLAALLSVDAFAGGLVLNSLVSLWLMQRFGLTLTSAGAFFFWAGLLSAASQLVAPWLSRRIGLLNTMVFTHIPANLCLVAAALAPTLPLALALLLVRTLLSPRDVPLLLCGGLKIVDDLTLWRACRGHPLPGE